MCIHHTFLKRQNSFEEVPKKFHLLKQPTPRYLVDFYLVSAWGVVSWVKRTEK